MMRASVWRSLVMIPDWLPVKLMASPPSSRMAIESSAIEMRSPAESSMSSSRRSGLAETCFAMPSRSSVVSPIAETTTTTSCPWRAGVHHALGHAPEFLNVGDAAAAVLLNNYSHAESISKIRGSGYNPPRAFKGGWGEEGSRALGLPDP